MLKRALLAVLMSGVAVLAFLAVSTDPGEIAGGAYAAENTVAPSYLAQLYRAERRDPSKIVVWVGRGLDTGHSAILPEAVPILFDKADVGKPVDRLRPKTRAQVEAVYARQDAALKKLGRKGIEDQVRGWIRDFDAGVSIADSHGSLAHFKDEGSEAKKTRDLLVRNADRYASNFASRILDSKP